MIKVLVARICLIFCFAAFSCSKESSAESDAKFKVAARAIHQDLAKAGVVLLRHADHAAKAAADRLEGERVSADVHEAQMAFDYGKVSDACSDLDEIGDRIRELPKPGADMRAARDELVSSLLLAEKLKAVQEWRSNPPSYTEIMSLRQIATEFGDSLTKIDLLLPNSN
jgi:hypothetical protein